MTDKVVIPTEVRAAADYIAKQVSFTDNTGKVESTFLANFIKDDPAQLGERLPSLEDVEKSFQLEALLVDAATLANGEAATDIMAKNKDYEHVESSMVLRAGKTRRELVTRFTRSGSVSGGPGAPRKEVKGIASGTMKAVAGRGVSSYKNVRDHLRTLAESKL